MSEAALGRTALRGPLAAGVAAAAASPGPRRALQPGLAARWLPGGVEGHAAEEAVR